MITKKLPMIEPFNSSESDIISDIKCTEQLFQCIEVPKEKQVAMFLILTGEEAYNALKDLVDSVFPSTKTYKDLMGVLSNHYYPKKLVVTERYKSYGARQDPSEDVKSFAAKLKKLSKFYKLGNLLNDALRDKFVCGLRSENIKRKLLTEEDLSWDKAFKIAFSMELAEGQARAMGPEVDAVNKLGNGTFGNLSKQLREKQTPKRSNFSSEGKPCYRCTRKHDPESCPAKNWECCHCYKKGHTSRACRKQTVNVLVKFGHRVLPLPEDIFACLSGNKYFTVINLKGAYQQIQISETFRELLTINTHIKLVSNTDVLSRLPIDGVTNVPDCLYLFNLINNVPLHNGDIVSALEKDNVLVKVTISGWPNAIPDQQIKQTLVNS
ncbi:hypothetical protein ILUMI_16986 [Ignelater luminosus]|uniref:Uncharacterized protein n=1 Tax=Ignelater luminosus TaxID=2038154 RepID=A0A8K0CPY2_IGNLU|nr:hypothetical protein ILUMI_16986 [Ignelater luminosus]